MKYHIMRNLNKEWIIREDKKEEVLFRSKFRDVCEKAGKTLATKYGDTVIVHFADGTVEYEMGVIKGVKITCSTKPVESIP
jgi:hypothetical protein